MQFEHVYLMLFISWSHRNSTSRMKANLANAFNACLNSHWLNVKQAGVCLITQAFKSRFHMLNNYSLIFMACLVSEINIYSLEVRRSNWFSQYLSSFGKWHNKISFDVFILDEAFRIVTLISFGLTWIQAPCLIVNYNQHKLVKSTLQCQT